MKRLGYRHLPVRSLPSDLVGSPPPDTCDSECTVFKGVAPVDLRYREAFRASTSAWIVMAMRQLLCENWRAADV